MSRSVRAGNHRQIMAVVVKFTNNDSRKKSGVKYFDKTKIQPTFVRHQLQKSPPKLCLMDFYIWLRLNLSINYELRS